MGFWPGFAIGVIVGLSLGGVLAGWWIAKNFRPFR